MCMLVVVMKVDKVLEGLFEKVILDVVSIGFGYVCVCNCIFVDDSIVVVRCWELELFNDYLDFRNIDWSMVGIFIFVWRFVKI